MNGSAPSTLRKRKRRRGAEKPALSAQLVIDKSLDGEAAVLSRDLFVELFPSYDHKSTTENKLYHVAVTHQKPWPSDNEKEDDWTFLTVQPTTSSSPQLGDFTKHSVHVSAASSTAQLILERFSKSTYGGPRSTGRAPVEIKVLDVIPIPLETIVFGLMNGDIPPRKEQGTDDDLILESSLKKDVAYALEETRLVHIGDLIHFSSATSGKTDHNRVAVVQLCEPVNQGFVTPLTRLVITNIETAVRRQKTPLAPKAPPLPAFTKDDDDASNEQFYSAAEGPIDSPARTVKKSRLPSVSVQASDSSSSEEEDTDLSDLDSDAIGLSLPGLPAQPSGSLSAYSSTTPRNGTFGNGTTTPGSIVSALSSSTVRGVDFTGKKFQTRELEMQIPEAVLHPKPAPDEDDEARIYTDSSSLAKLGCFSGDWIHVEVDTGDPFSSLASWNATSSGLNSKQPGVTRVAKVYALPGVPEIRPRYVIDRSGRRGPRLSFNHTERPSLVVYLPPMLLANLGFAKEVRLAPIPAPVLPSKPRTGRQQQRMPSTSLPPPAKELSLGKVATPIATQREIQNVLTQKLRKWFQDKKRIVKPGDLLAIPFDEDVGRAMYRGSTAEMDNDQEELHAAMYNCGNGSQSHLQVVWFKVGVVVSEATKDEADHDVSDLWADMTLVIPGSTRMSQTGSEQAKLPAMMQSHWQQYYGLRKRRKATGADFAVTSATLSADEYISQTRRRLRELISAAISPQAVHFKLPPVAVLLVSTQRQIGKATAAQNACADLGVHIFSIDGYDILSGNSSGGGDNNTAALLEVRAERAMSCGASYTALLVRHIDVLTADKMANTLRNILSIARVLIATTSSIDKVPDDVRSLFTHELEMAAPDEGEREGLLHDISQQSDVPIASDVDFAAVAVKTAALVAGDLVDVVDRATVAREDRLEKLAATANQSRSSSEPRVSIRDIQLAGGDSARSLIRADFDVAVDAARKNFADAIGAPKIPNVSWDDVGGLSNVKDAVMETIQLPLERPELFAKGMKKRSGILFYGPPGTGKTLLAKAIATEFSLNFFSVKGPELLNMYIGESEANVRRVFQRARDARPCVVFFDELDSVAPKRGNQGDSGGVMDRIVSQLLAELDGMSNGEDGAGGGVFVIGATNRPDLLDQALLRPGRFDKMLYLGVSDTHEKQLTILEALTRKFTLHPKLSLRNVASSLPFTYTGADLYALCSDAMLKAITRRASSVDAKVRSINSSRSASSPPQPPITVAYFFDHLAEPDDTNVVVNGEDFDQARIELVPSVSVKELEHYTRVRQTFEKGEEKQPSNGSVNKPKARMPQQLVPLRPRPNGHGAQRGGLDAQTNGNHDEDLVSRTESLSLNGNPHNVADKVEHALDGSSAGGKGKGKAVIRPEPDLDDNRINGNGFGDATNGDDGLYE